jgi:hypothetical protein
VEGWLNVNSQLQSFNNQSVAEVDILREMHDLQVIVDLTLQQCNEIDLFLWSQFNATYFRCFFFLALTDKIYFDF